MFTKLVGSFGGTKSPVSPSITISSGAPIAVAISGAMIEDEDGGQIEEIDLNDLDDNDIDVVTGSNI